MKTRVTVTVLTSCPSGPLPALSFLGHGSNPSLPHSKNCAKEAQKSFYIARFLIRVAVTTSMRAKTHTQRVLKSVAQLLVLERASGSGVIEVLLLNIRFSTPRARTAYALQSQGLRASIIHDRIRWPICQCFCFKTVCDGFAPAEQPASRGMWKCGGGTQEASTQPAGDVIITSGSDLAQWSFLIYRLSLNCFSKHGIELDLNLSSSLSRTLHFKTEDIFYIYIKNNCFEIRSFSGSLRMVSVLESWKAEQTNSIHKHFQKHFMLYLLEACPLSDNKRV